MRLPLGSHRRSAQLKLGMNASMTESHAPETKRPSAALLHRIFETSLDLILVTDRQGNIIQVNPICYEILGYRPDEMIGHEARNFLYPPDLDATREEMRRARKTHSIQRFNCRYVHKGGDVVTLNWTGIWGAPEQRHFFIGRDVSHLQTIEKLNDIQQQLEDLNRTTASNWFFFGTKTSEVYTIEIAMILCSLWAYHALSAMPGNYFALTNNLQVVEILQNQTQFWAYFALMAALIKMLGFALKLTEGKPGIVFTLRTIGLSMSGVFWSLMGIGVLYGNPDTLFGFVGLIFGLVAWLFVLQIGRRYRLHA
jgi:PAS domain S-box-containing protein